MTNHLRISTDTADIDFAVVHGFLSRDAYWCRGVPAATLRKAIENSLCFSAITDDGAQVGFARVVTDRATFAYLADVFVLEGFRGRGHGRAIVAALMTDDALHGLRRWHLVTRDMQALYTGFDFTALTQPERHMQRHDPDVYRRACGD